MTTRRRKTALDEEEVEVVSLHLWRVTIGLGSGALGILGSAFLWLGLRVFTLQQEVAVLSSSFTTVAATVLPGQARVEATLKAIEIDLAKKEGVWNATQPSSPPSRSR